MNPDGLRNQVEGSVVQGLGGALFEAIEFADGHVRNGTMEQYRVPRFQDVPVIETILLDRRDIPSAGAGETPIVCVAPAIGSAVRGFGQVDTALPIRLLSPSHIPFKVEPLAEAARAKFDSGTETVTNLCK